RVLGAPGLLGTLKACSTPSLQRVFPQPPTRACKEFFRNLGSHTRLRLATCFLGWKMRNGQFPACFTDRLSPILRIERRRAASGKGQLGASGCGPGDKAGNPERPAPEEHPPGLCLPNQLAGWRAPGVPRLTRSPVGLCLHEISNWWLAICVFGSRIYGQ